MRTYKNRGKGGAIGAQASFVCYVMILLFTVAAARADTITVGLGAGHDFNNIQAAIDDANDGDEVIVADGTYIGTGNRDIDFSGKAITVQSENGPENCIINCENFGSGFYLHTAEDGNSVIDGFTIRNAYGSGIFCTGSSPAIRNCNISDNWGYPGGGIDCRDNSHATISDCTISSNTGGHGGGIACYDNSNITINRCSIIGNSGWDNAGGIYVAYSSVAMKNCRVVGNAGTFYGGAIACQGAVLTAIDCTFANNSASAFGGDFLACVFQNQEASYIDIANCIVRNSISPILNENNSVISISYSDIQSGWPGNGNIDADPCFAESGHRDANGTPGDILDDFWFDGDYRLLEGSPCINTGDSNYVAEINETDLDGNPRLIGYAVDMGAYEFNPPIEAEMKFTPQELNCGSKGKWISCQIWLPEGYDVTDVNSYSILLEEEIEAEWIRFNEKQNLAMAKFNRSKLSSILEEGDVELTVSGFLNDGRYFTGTDTIKVIGIRDNRK
jgi:hypothetical protein